MNGVCVPINCPDRSDHQCAYIVPIPTVPWSNGYSNHRRIHAQAAKVGRIGLKDLKYLYIVDLDLGF